MKTSSALLFLLFALSAGVYAQVHPCMAGNNLVYPYVTITADKSSICSGSEITFTASTVNAGPSPSYQWNLNGENVGGNAPVFTSRTLKDGDIVNCFLTGSALCSMPAVSMNDITVNVNTGWPCSGTNMNDKPETIITEGVAMVIGPSPASIIFDR